MYFLQTPKQVWTIWERDHFVRRIYLTDRHSENVKPSWFGESIGHYEGGDTLVVDTIGLAGGKNHYIDSFRTPHTDKLHVVERFTISQDGRSLTAVGQSALKDCFADSGDNFLGVERWCSLHHLLLVGSRSA